MAAADLGDTGSGDVDEKVGVDDVAPSVSLVIGSGKSLTRG
jgi:hypothetical protein